jgi:hypothetical protein
MMTEAELDAKICETRARLGTPLANLDRDSGRESRDTKSGVRIRSWLADNGMQVEVARGDETTLMFAMTYGSMFHLMRHLGSRTDAMLGKLKERLEND